MSKHITEIPSWPEEGDGTIWRCVHGLATRPCKLCKPTIAEAEEALRVARWHATSDVVIGRCAPTDAVNLDDMQKAMTLAVDVADAIHGPLPEVKT